MSVKYFKFQLNVSCFEIWPLNRCTCAKMYSQNYITIVYCQSPMIFVITYKSLICYRWVNLYCVDYIKFMRALAGFWEVTLVDSVKNGDLYKI